MSNLSEATEALMTEATADAVDEVDAEATVVENEADDTAETEETETAEGEEPPAAKVEVEPFKMDPSGRPFQRLRALYDSGDTDTFSLILDAMELVFGEVPEDIEKGFHSTLKVEKAKGEIQKYDKELAGYTPGQSLIKLLEQGTVIAQGAGGTVSWNISLTTEGEGDDAKQKVIFKSAFRGIDGISSKGNGGALGSYDYFDNCTLITTSLKKYIVEKHSSSHAAGLIAKNVEDRAAGKKSGLSSFEAAKTGMENGDTFVITRSKKKVESK